MTSSRADAFPAGSARRSVRFEIFDSAEPWEKCWKRLQEKAPAVDFKKEIVLFVMYEKWPGTLELSRSFVKDDVLTVEFALDDEGLREVPENREERGKPGSEPDPEPAAASPDRCRYEWRMRSISRTAVKEVRIVHDRAVLGRWDLAKRKRPATRRSAHELKRDATLVVRHA